MRPADRPPLGLTRLGGLALALGLVGAGCAAPPLRADGSWTELRSVHFRVLTDVPPDAVGRELPRVETVLAGIAARLAPDRPLPARVDLLWLRRQDDVAALGVAMARGYYLPHQGDEPSTPPLVVVGGAPGREVEQALVHELAHVVFVEVAPSAPPWLAEGMAAWWDTLDVDGANVGFDDDTNAAGMTRATTGLHTIHLSSVHSLLHATFTAFHQSLLSGYTYGSARAFLAMLESEPDLKMRLDAYLARLREGAGAADAWNDGFAGMSVTDLQQRFDQFWLTRRQPLPLPPYRGAVAARSESPPAVERWLARARPWDSPSALVAAGRALGRAAGDDSAERHYWSGVHAAALQRWSTAVAELRLALARDPSLTMASSALARVDARLRHLR